MSELTLLVVGFAAMTPWGRDQIRRLGEQARRRGLRLLGADTPENLRRAPAEDLAVADEVVSLDVHDRRACRAWAVAGGRRVDAVLAIRELSVLPAAEIARGLGLAGSGVEAVVCVRNKDLCRRRLCEAGFPQPRSALCESPADARRFMSETASGPWVVKPRDGLGSVGVSRIDHPRELRAALAAITAPPPAAGFLPPSPYFLIETFVAGREYSAEGVMIGGVPQVLALTRKTVSNGFVSMTQRVPSGLDRRTAEVAAGTVSGALTAVGITHGIFHVEFWVTATGIVLGEIHDRGGGDYIHALVEYTRPGLELYGMLIDDLLGRAPSPVPEAAGSARAEFLVAPPGTLRAIHGWDSLVRHPAVKAAHLDVSPGDLIEQATNSYSRSAAFVVATDSDHGIDELATSLASRITFDTN